MQTEGSAHVGKSFDVVVKLVNLLSVPLTGGHLNIEGPGMQRTSSIKVKYVPGDISLYMYADERFLEYHRCIDSKVLFNGNSGCSNNYANYTSCTLGLWIAGQGCITETTMRAFFSKIYI